MKLYLDDIRKAPKGWKLVRWPKDAINLLKKNSNVTDISLDHDLGNDNKGTGYDVILWIEKKVATENFFPPNIIIHTSNPSARRKMEAGVRNIYKFAERNS